MHLVTPPLHGPEELPHAWPSPGTLSSTSPLQSLSIPSHCSPVGPTPPLHTRPPPLHTVTPGSHAPIELPHGCPTSTGLLSGTPLQSSSRPLQRSTLGPISPAHCRLPPTQIVWPSVHWPVLFEPHGIPTSVGLSSTTPLQSSSRPLHVSGPPLLPPWQTRAPPTQCSVPGVHTPSEPPHDPPPPGSASSVWPLQSLSLPSQISTFGPVLSSQTSAPF